MVLHEKGDIDCIYSNISLEFIIIHSWGSLCHSNYNLPWTGNHFTSNYCRGKRNGDLSIVQVI